MLIVVNRPLLNEGAADILGQPEKLARIVGLLESALDIDTLALDDGETLLEGDSNTDTEGTCVFV